MAETIIVAGIGPGDPDYVIPRATAAIRAADVVVGGKRALATFATERQLQIPVTGKLQELAKAMRAVPETSRIVVLVSGDPGYYSLLPWVKRTFPEAEVEVIPGLSSMQVAFARLAEVWQDAALLSFHGRVPEPAELVYAPGRKLGFLTDAEHNPGFICRELMAHGWPAETRVDMLEKISYAEERRRSGTLAECADETGFSHSIVVVRG
ncbi:MAG: precorrin-6y C5,15-methyltransferase (decarboxylating) subunit CbiE [Veillonellaceae bacterium]|nr:precorrin-6y C5,15-methyltransferase (decarboxylating) subunit CbiE [Veillonellaceae bacterium]